MSIMKTDEAITQSSKALYYKVKKIAIDVNNESDDSEATDAGGVGKSKLNKPWWYNFIYLVAGIFFGIVIVKAEVISWYRIQEMFRLQRFHMYGVIGSAVAVGAVSIWIIKKFNIKTIHQQPINIAIKKFSKGQLIGGVLFGFGWAMTGSCPGPLLANIGYGATVLVVTLLSAIAGTWVYGKLKERLPH